MVRILIGFLMAAGITLGLFFLMSFVIKVDPNRNEAEDLKPIQITMAEPEQELKKKTRRIPKKPPPPKEPPPPEVQKVSQTNKPTVQPLDIKMAKLDFSVAGDGPFLGGFGQVDTTTDGEAIPMVTIEPRYPPKAAMDGIQGWVRFKFTVNPDGSVKDVELVDSEPRRVFDKEARRAIYKWKFKPRVVDGKAVEQPNMYYTIEFTLAQ